MAGFIFCQLSTMKVAKRSHDKITLMRPSRNFMPTCQKPRPPEIQAVTTPFVFISCLNVSPVVKISARRG
jgi:hypothetical protein